MPIPVSGVIKSRPYLGARNRFCDETTWMWNRYKDAAMSQGVIQTQRASFLTRLYHMSCTLSL